MGVDLSFYCGESYWKTPRYYPDHDVIGQIQSRQLNKSDKKPNGIDSWPTDGYGSPITVIKSSDLERVLDKLNSWNQEHYRHFVNRVQENGKDPDIYLYWH